MNFQDLIQDKRVCYVGPSPCFIGKNEGELIDSFDVVCKPINFLWVDKILDVDFGSRADVVYPNGQFGRLMNPPIHKLIKKNTQWIRMKQLQENWLIWAEGAGIGIESTVPAIREVSRFAQGCTTGIISIQDILRNRPKELYLTGMDFYSSREYPQGKFLALSRDISKEYIPGYQVPEFVNQLQNAELETNKWDTHNHYFGSKWIQDKYLNKELTMSPYSYSLLLKSLEKYYIPPQKPKQFGCNQPKAS